MGIAYWSGNLKKSNTNTRLILTTLMGIVFGFFIGTSFPALSLTKINLHSSLISSLDLATNDVNKSTPIKSKAVEKFEESLESIGSHIVPKIFIGTDYGANQVRISRKKPKYLVTFTVGIDQLNNINASIRKFSDDFQIMLFHYDGRTSDWDEFEWSKSAIHVSVKKQTKWWYAKRFLHPYIVAAYEYIFIWDEDLGVEHFNGEKYIQLVKKHGLEISQPGLEPNDGQTWQMTKRRGDREVHKYTEEKPGWCNDPHLPPSWRCVWHMIQNDLVARWGLDFALRRCVEPSHEKIGFVDSQWIIHQVIPSLGNQGQAENGEAPWEGVRKRCKSEWAEFQNCLAAADKEYLAQIGKD